ncbi:hypothetical protein Hdeb2414_s0067g00768551 [Helianthus debilis subsp. tardiflorus]
MHIHIISFTISIFFLSLIQRSNKMVNAFAVLAPLLHGLVKLAGLTPQTIEIVPGTLMNIWVPKETVTKKDKDIVFVPPTKPAVLLLHAFAMNGISHGFHKFWH